MSIRGLCIFTASQFDRPLLPTGGADGSASGGTSGGLTIVGRSDPVGAGPVTCASRLNFIAGRGAVGGSTATGAVGGRFGPDTIGGRLNFICCMRGSGIGWGSITCGGSVGCGTATCTGAVGCGMIAGGGVVGSGA